MKLDLNNVTMKGSDIIKLIILLISGCGFYFGTTSAITAFTNYMRINDAKIELIQKDAQANWQIVDQRLRRLEDNDLKRQAREEFERGEYVPLIKQKK